MKVARAADSAVETARALLPEIARNAVAADRDALFPEESVNLLRRSGLMGLLVPEEYGGLGGELRDLVAVGRLLGSACQSTAMIWAMHCQQVDMIVRFGTSTLRGKLLPRVATGELYIASVTTETGKGTLLEAVSAVDEQGSVLVLDRDAPVVTGGRCADGFLMTMRAAAQAPRHQVSLIYADRADLEVTVRAAWNPLGMRGTESGGLHLAGRVPALNLVGPTGGFAQIAADSLVPVAHLGWSACWLGAAHAALSDVVALIRSGRAPSGLDVGSDLAAERLARIRIDLETVAAYLAVVTAEVTHARDCGRIPDRPEEVIHINSLKIIASELCFRAVDGLVSLVGLSLGYSRDSPVRLERHLRDLRSAALNYANSRLLVTNGNLALMDRRVALAGEQADLRSPASSVISATQEES